MIPATLQPLVVFIALLTGAALGQYWRARWIRKNQSRLRKEARQILRDAQIAGKGTIAEAEVKAREMLVAERRVFDQQAENLRANLLAREEVLNKRFEMIANLEAEAEKKRLVVEQQEKNLHARIEDLEKQRLEYVHNLKQLSGLSLEEARKMVLEKARKDAETAAESYSQTLFRDLQSSADQRAKKIMADVIERLSRSFGAERSLSMISLESDEMKGRIIGRDGRNIRAFEAITGVDVLLDEIPGHAVLSCHSPERRETAKVALVALIKDGRIQPSRIEEFVRIAQQEIQNDAHSAGRAAAEDAGIHALHPDIYEILGRLRFRSSHTQNVLLHSVETAKISALLCAELNINQPESAEIVRAAFLHDIGKAISEDQVGPHALVGATFLAKHGESEVVVNAVAAHHQQEEDRSIACPIVRAADALSGARPGARREDYEAYIKRMSALETLALQQRGVERAYALQAGRELHVIVQSEIVSDAGARDLVANLVVKIQRELRQSEDIKITVVRETRFTQAATWSTPE